MSTIDIGISHDNNLVITKLGDIEVISVSFGETTSECIDHSFDFGIGKNLVYTCLFYVQDFTSDRQDSLIHSVSCSLCRTTRRITLYDEDFALFGILGFAVCKFTV